MKTRITLKDFRALLFDAGNGTDGTVRANLNTPPRLTPESVGDFTVEHDSSADVGSPQDERLATKGNCLGWNVAAQKRVMLGRWLWMTPAQPSPGSE